MITCFYCSKTGIDINTILLYISDEHFLVKSTSEDSPKLQIMTISDMSMLKVQLEIDVFILF